MPLPDFILQLPYVLPQPPDDHLGIYVLIDCHLQPGQRHRALVDLGALPKRAGTSKAWAKVQDSLMVLGPAAAPAGHARAWSTVADPAAHGPALLFE